MPNLGAIRSNTIFCEISLVPVPQALISATRKTMRINGKTCSSRTNPFSFFGCISRYCNITGNRQIYCLLYALWKQRIGLLYFSLNLCLFESGRSLLTFPAYKLAGYLRWAPIRGWALNRMNTVFDQLPHFLVGLSL